MKFFLLFLLLFQFQQVSAKSFDSYGAIAFLQLSKKLNEKYDLNFLNYNTFNFTERSFQGKTYPEGFIQTYFQTAINYKWHPDLNLSLGYIYQRNDPFDDDFTDENRIFEQITLARQYDATQVTHRFRLEERFVNNSGDHEFKTRVRYQIGASAPLDGRQLDPGEWYVNCYNEFYFSTTGERNAFFSDDWVYVGLGYLTHDWGKLEAGPLAQYSVVNEDKDVRSFYSLWFGWNLKF